MATALNCPDLSGTYEEANSDLILTIEQDEDNFNFDNGLRGGSLPLVETTELIEVIPANDRHEELEVYSTVKCTLGIEKIVTSINVVGTVGGQETENTSTYLKTDCGLYETMAVKNTVNGESSDFGIVFVRTWIKQ